jgi:WD40 repeat protein
MSFFGHTDSVTCGGFTNDGKYLVTGSEDMTVKTWDLKNNSLITTIKGVKFHQSPITVMAIAKNKNIIATGGLSNEIAISNAESGNVKKQLLNIYFFFIFN